MKPFDLEAALNGKPVKLRGGSKTYVKYVMPADYKGDYPLQGYINTYSDYVTCSWTLNGLWKTGCESNGDIVGMWEEPVEMVSINGHEFPKPCTESLANDQPYWAITVNCGNYIVLKDIWVPTVYDARRLEARNIHLTEEAAQAHADALNKAHQELVK